MKIVFDGKRAVLNDSGLGNYSRWVINAMCELHPENKYIVLTPKLNYKYNLPFNCLLKAPTKRIHQLLKSLWRVCGWGVESGEGKIDIYHGLSNELPFGLKSKKIKAVVTIHDLIFLRYPHYYPFIDRLIYNFKFKYAATHADKIIAISEQTANDLKQFYNISQDRIDVIYQDCNAFFHIPSTEEELLYVRKKYNLNSDYLVAVGTIEQRKNQLSILKAFELVADKFPNLELIMVGKETAYQKVIEEAILNSKYKERVKVLNQVSTVEIKSLYSGAKAALYLSVFEGFGLPVLEALNCKVPVLTSNVSSMPEAGGDAAMYCDPNNYEDVAQKLEVLLGNEAVRASFISRMESHVMKFRKEKTVAQMNTLYSRLLD